MQNDWHIFIYLFVLGGRGVEVPKFDPWWSMFFGEKEMEIHLPGLVAMKCSGRNVFCWGHFSSDRRYSCKNTARYWNSHTLLPIIMEVEKCIPPIIVTFPLPWLLEKEYALVILIKLLGMLPLCLNVHASQGFFETPPLSRSCVSQQLASIKVDPFWEGKGRLYGVAKRIGSIKAGYCIPSLKLTASLPPKIGLNAPKRKGSFEPTVDFQA